MPIYKKRDCDVEKSIKFKGFTAVDFTSAQAKVGRRTVPGGDRVYEYVIYNDHMAVTLMDYGATVKSIELLRDGSIYRDVALGYDRREDYEKGTCYLGCVCGPLANRTAGAKFSRGGHTVTLDANDGGVNHLHGGAKGCAKRYFSSVETGDGGVMFDLHHEVTSDTGLTSTLCTRVIYQLAGTSDLVVHYQAFYVGGGEGRFLPQPVNLTNHTYFNLNGHNSGPIYDHYVKLEADDFTPVDDKRIPTGEVQAVTDCKELDMDLRQYKHLKDTVTPDSLLWYDNSFVLRGETSRRRYLLPLAASVFCKASEVGLLCYTDQPCLQLYTGNYLSNMKGKGGAQYHHHHALCLETQQYVNAANETKFPNIYIEEDEIMKSTTVYSFQFLKSTEELDSRA